MAEPAGDNGGPALRDVPTTPLHGWVRQLFEALGSSADEARLTADHLIGANLAGHDSHGVGMIPTYVDACHAGHLSLNREIDVIVDTGAMLVVDGGMGIGQSVARQAMTLAIERANAHGIALLGLRNAHHIGRIGHWAEMAIEAGLVGIHFTNAMTTTPVVAPHGGIDARFVTNPFTVGIPRADGEPILLDFATSAIAHGKARVAMMGVPISTATCSPIMRVIRIPALVSIVAGDFSNSQPMQRVALPQASTSLPSALMMRMVTSALLEGSSRITWSQPMPDSLSASFCQLRVGITCERPSSTTKSLPNPSIFMKGSFFIALYNVFASIALAIQNSKNNLVLTLLFLLLLYRRSAGRFACNLHI